MIDEEAKAILKKTFAILTPEQIENFRWHLRNETPVLCGHGGFINQYFCDGRGG